MINKHIQKVDEATLTVLNNFSNSVNVFTRLEECIQCSFSNQAIVKPYHQNLLVLNTRYSNDIKVVEIKFNNSCLFTSLWFQEEGHYQLSIVKNSSNSSLLNCTLTTSSEPDVFIHPLLIAFIFIFWLLSTTFVINFLTSKNASNDSTKKSIQPSTSQKSESSNRVKFIDCFRGLTILLMIFVNYGGSGYSYFIHKPWFGVTFADFVFPFFIFIMGISISFSIQFKLQKNEQLAPIFKEILKRSLKLFLLGLMINSISETSLGKIRIPGVLQRFSISYFAVAVLHLITVVKISKRTSNFSSSLRLYHFSDFFIYWFEWIWILLALIIYFILTFTWRYSNSCPVGYQGPGGLHEHEKYFNCTGGAARALDILVFGPNHIYKHNSVKEIYHNTLDHDPEGLLGIFTSIVLTYFGLQAGKILTIYKSQKHVLIHWLIWFLFLLLLVPLLTTFNPLCKNLWSFSFVCLTGSTSFALLIFFHLLFKNNTLAQTLNPIVSAGKNSILIYFGHEILHKILPFYFDVDETSHFWLTIRSLVPVNLWIWISVYLNNKKIYLKI